MPETVPALREVEPVDPEERPPWILRLNITLLVFVALLGVWSFRAFRPDRQEIMAKSADICAELLAKGSGHGWKRRMRLPWPPQEQQIDVHRVLPAKGSAEQQADALLARVGIVPHEELRLDQDEAKQYLKGARRPLLVLTAEDGPLAVSFGASFYAAEMPSVPSFVWREKTGPLGLWGRRLLHLILLLAIAAALRTGLIARYRARRRRDFEIYQREVTARRFQEKSDLDEARRFAEQGQIAQALVRLNRALASNPGYVEAAQLKRLLQADPALTQGNPGLLGLRHDAAAENEPALYLRVLGTPYAYLAPVGTEILRLGRQRRKSGEAPDSGNDLVIRVPGSDKASLRISRRHLEIQRIDKDYFVLDQSRGLTRLNGQILEPEMPIPIHSGDRLILGGVITLEVLFRARIASGQGQSALQVQPAEGESGPIVTLEATIGDMVTEVHDD